MKRVTALAISVAVIALLAGCDKTNSYYYDASIKKSEVDCGIKGQDIWKGGGGTVLYAQYSCSFASTAGGGEHPYVILHLEGCTKRIDGEDGSSFVSSWGCAGDPMKDVGIQLCQTHGGPLPDDCNGTTWYDMTMIT